MDDREILQWDKRLTDQARRGWDNYKHLHIDLSTARIDQSYRIAGEYLYVEESSSFLAIAKIRLNRKNNDALDLEKGVNIETVFIEIFITNDALEDEWFDLVFGINFKYKKKITDNGGGLPKTQQTVSYANGDDGYYEAGWNGRPRWTPRTLAGDDVVIDNATGLMWAADDTAAGCNFGAPIAWAAGIAYANTLNFAGYTDWRIPNVKELQSIINYGLNSPALDCPPFACAPARYCPWWTSTTDTSFITWAWWVAMQSGEVNWAVKTDTIPIRCVRGGL